MSPSSNRDYAYAGVSVAVGLVALVATQSIVAEPFAPILEACQAHPTSDALLLAHPSLHEYWDDVWGDYGNPFVCLMTQFFRDLASTPQGYFVWMTFVGMLLPMTVLQMLEAGRGDARRGPLHLPGVLFQLSLFLAAGAVVPLLWIPSYVLGRGTGGVSSNRITASILVALPILVASLLLMEIPTDRRLWTIAAGIFGSPAIPVLMGVVGTMLYHRPDPANKEAAQRSSDLATLPFAACGMITVLVWMWVVFMVSLPEFGFIGPRGWYQLLRETASPPVRFMTIDLVAMWLASLVLLAHHSSQSALEFVGLSFLFGPGAALSLVLTGMQVQDRIDARADILSAASDAIAREDFERKRKEVKESKKRA